MKESLSDFNQFRREMNEEIHSSEHLGMKRFFALDHQAYQDGALTGNTKELLGLVASAVLRCDDCITYHLVQCGEAGWKRRGARGRQPPMNPSPTRCSWARPLRRPKAGLQSARRLCPVSIGISSIRAHGAK